jgi:hypothetical protein
LWWWSKTGAINPSINQVVVIGCDFVKQNQKKNMVCKQAKGLGLGLLVQQRAFNSPTNTL